MRSLPTIYHCPSLVGLFSFVKKFEGISVLTYKMTPPLFESQSNLYGVLKLSIKKLTIRKGVVNFCFRNHKYINITFNLIFQ